MRQSITPEDGVQLKTYFDRMQSNFSELYKKVDSGESNFTGISGESITSGVVPDECISTNIARLQDVNDLPDYILIFENKLI